MRSDGMNKKIAGQIKILFLMTILQPTIHKTTTAGSKIKESKKERSGIHTLFAPTSELKA
jgi:hypothetical protein